MLKFNLRSLALLFIILNSCTENSPKYQITKSDLLDIIIAKKYFHLQSNAEINLLKENNIKSAVFIEENLGEQKIDSVTCLQYDRNGRIKNRTTTECTTIGCLPYIIRQEYIYSNNKIVQMRDYTFRHKYKRVKNYWELNDTNKLALFDWEDYTYSPDTIKVKSATQLFIYTIDKKNRIVYRELNVKMNNQRNSTKLEYSTSGVELLESNNSWNIKFKEEIEIINLNTAIEKIFRDSLLIKQKEYVFNDLGLLAEISNFKNDTLTYKTKIIYDKY